MGQFQNIYTQLALLVKLGADLMHILVVGYLFPLATTNAYLVKSRAQKPRDLFDQSFRNSDGII